MAAEPRQVRTERDRQREETRRRVYVAALEVFRRDGFQKARIEDIADLASVSRGAFYFHFATKEDVLLQLLRERQESLAGEIAALPAEQPLVDTMHAVARSIAASWEGDPAMLVEIGIVALRLTANELPQFREFHPAERALAVRFIAAQERGELGFGLPAELQCDFFLVSLFAAAVGWGGRPEIPLDLVLAQVVEFFRRGSGMSMNVD